MNIFKASLLPVYVFFVKTCNSSVNFFYNIISFILRYFGALNQRDGRRCYQHAEATLNLVNCPAPRGMEGQIRILYCETRPRRTWGYCKGRLASRKQPISRFLRSIPWPSIALAKAVDDSSPLESTRYSAVHFSIFLVLRQQRLRRLLYLGLSDNTHFSPVPMKTKNVFLLNFIYHLLG